MGLSTGQATGEGAIAAPRWRSLRCLLGFGVLVPVLATLGLSLAVANWQMRESVDRAGQRWQQAAASHARDRVAHYLGESVQLNRWVRDGLRVRQWDANNPTGLDRWLWQQLQQFQALNLAVFAADGTSLVGIQRTPPGSLQLWTVPPQAGKGLTVYNTDSQGNRSGLVRQQKDFAAEREPWFRAATLAGQATWLLLPDVASAPNAPSATDSTATANQSPIAVAAEPVVGSDGRRLGVVASGLSLAPLRSELAQWQGMELAVIDRTGRILVVSERATANQLPTARDRWALLLEKWQQSAGSPRTWNGEQFATATLNQQTYRLWATPLGAKTLPDWLVVVAMPLEGAADPGGIALNVALVLVTIGTGLGVTWLLLRAIEQPLASFEQMARAMTSGQTIAPIESTGLRELDEAMRQVQLMMRELRAATTAFERDRDALLERIRDRTNALSLSETKFSKIFYASPSGICLLRLEDSCVLDFNDSFLNIFGYSFEEMMGFSNMEFNIWLRAEDRISVMQALQRGSSVQNQEVAIRTKGHAVRTVLLSAEPLYLHGMECALLVVHDITDYKGLEEDLRQSQERLAEMERRRALALLEVSRDELRSTLEKLETVLGSVRDALVWTDELGQVQWCNPAFERLIQLDRDQVIGRALVDCLPLMRRGRSVPVALHPVAQAFQGGSGSTAYEFQSPSGDRYSLEIAWSSVTLPDPEGAPNRNHTSAVLAIRDITERKRLIAEVLRAKRFIDGIVEHIPLAVYVKDVRQQFRFVLWNRASERLFGIPRDRALGHTADDLFPIKRATTILEQDVQATEERHELEIPEEVVHGPEGDMVLRTVRVPLFDSSGNVAYLLCITDDITQRKQAEQALQESQAQFRMLTEQASGDLMLVHDVHGQILDANQQVCRVLGYSKAELLQMNIQAIDTLASLDQHDRIWAMMQPGQPVTLEGMYRCHNGHTFPVETRVGMRASHGQKIFLAMARDVTDRKQMEEALQRAEENYRSIVENAVEGIFQCAPNGQFLGGNQSLAKMFGFDSIEDMLGPTGLNRTRRFYADPERWNSFLTAITARGTIYNFESQVFDRNGETFWVSENARTVLDSDGRLLYYEGTIQNITERKLAEEALFAEQEKSDRLLLNILPKAIAERLKQGEGSLAEQYAEATILFADLVGFTPVSAQMRPIELVNLLNQIFSTFDQLAETHELEKIKTVGDEYMAVGGLPVPKPDHVQAVAQLALDMQAAISTFKTPDGKPFQIRIGINTGSVVAGVIGIKKFAYDLWGDTVNVASRMETQGEPGKIQVTEAVYQVLKDEFELVQRGPEPLDVKGRGLMKTYWLIGRKAPAIKTETKTSSELASELASEAEALSIFSN
jgi:PAS domain S-box-containing protein